MLVIGHRGASADEAENTPAAFRRAAEQGADGVELDVWLSDDGRLLVHHDPLPDGPAADALPTLAEALDACDGMLVNVEIKTLDETEPRPGHDVAAAVIEELRARGEPSRWLISSFSRRTVDRCRALAPEIPTAVLVLVADDTQVRSMGGSGHLAVHPHVDTVDREVVARCAAAGLTVNVWTCNDPERVAELAALGVDGVCTDVPDVALRALGRSPGATVRPEGWGRRA